MLASDFPQTLDDIILIDEYIIMELYNCKIRLVGYTGCHAAQSPLLLEPACTGSASHDMWRAIIALHRAVSIKLPLAPYDVEKILQHS